MDKMWKEIHYTANLSLQILLFFNVYVSIIWSLIFLYHLIYHILTLKKIQMIFLIFGFVLSSPAEILRLYLGYSGNLKSKISDLSGFLILTTLIQLPVHVYFIYITLQIEDWSKLFWLQLLILILIIIEIPIGSYASRKLSKYQAQLYHINLIANSQKLNKY